MSSINLLPKNFGSDDGKKQNSGSRFAILISLVMILIPIILCAVLYFKNINYSQEVTGLSSEVEKIDEEIKKKIENNKLLLVEDKAAVANSLLTDHPYFTNIINLINKNLIADLYLTSMTIGFDKQKPVTVEFKTIAKNNPTIASQIFVFKNMTEIENVAVNNIAPTEEGFLEFNIKLEIAEQVIFFKELTAEEKIIRNCKRTEEKIESDNLTIKISVEDSCCLIEAIRTEETDICQGIETDYNKCSCNAIVDFLSLKSKEEKVEIIGSLKTPYYETGKRILAEPILKEVINSSCIIKDEEIVAWCSNSKNEHEKESCYLLATIDSERKSICNEIKNSCYQCSCSALIDFLAIKSDEEKEEIIGDKERPTQWIVDDIFKNYEIADAVNNLCEDICQN